jgi:hypothetical protein
VAEVDSDERHSLEVKVDPVASTHGKPWRTDLTFYFDEDSATTVGLSTYPNRPILLRVRFMGFRD